MSHKFPSVTSPLHQRLRQRLAQAGGWLPFDEFMALVLYAPGLGYYSSGAHQLGRMPATGSDFVTAPELSPLFGRALARQVAQALHTTQTHEVWEFGAGTGALAAQLLQALAAPGAHAHTAALQRYHIVDLSGSLRQRQQQTLAPWGERVQWHERLPDVLRGVVLGNEVLDAMPVKLLARTDGRWHERGVALQGDQLCLADRASELRPPLDVPGVHDYCTEVHPQAQAFVATLAERLQAGVALFMDYGFPEHEYYHPQRHMGTLMCHRGHRSDTDPLSDLGCKDITAHVNFTGIALAAQNAGWSVLGYTSQARFLINCGLVDDLQNAPLAQRAQALKLINEHEMGELFKVIALAPQAHAQLLGFAVGDRTHRL